MMNLRVSHLALAHRFSFLSFPLTAVKMNPLGDFGIFSRFFSIRDKYVILIQL